MISDYLVVEYVVNELHDFFLIANPVAVPQVLSLIVLIHALLEL